MYGCTPYTGRRVRAAALARVLVHVDPAARRAPRAAAAGSPAPSGATDAGSHSSTSSYGYLPIEVDQRNRRVVGVVRVEAEHALAQPVVAAQRLGAGLRRLDQVLDDRGRDVVAVQRRVERRRVAARLRVEPVALQHAVVERRVRVDVGRVQLVERRERRGAIGLVAVGRQNRAVLAVGQRDLGAGRQRDRRVLDVGRRQRRVGVVRRRREAARRATAGARPSRRARAPAGGRDPRWRSGRPPGPAGRAIHAWTVASGIFSSSGLNQALACAAFANRICTCWRLRVDLVVALILVVPERREVPDLVRRAGRCRRDSCQRGEQPVARPARACPAARRTRAIFRSSSS